MRDTYKALAGANHTHVFRSVIVDCEFGGFFVDIQCEPHCNLFIDHPTDREASTYAHWQFKNKR